MTEICQRCKEDGEDRRTLWMACFYDMNELEIPFKKEKIIEEVVQDFANKEREFFTLRVCKNCRADWLSSIKEWFNEIVIDDNVHRELIIKDGKVKGFK